MKKRMLLDMTYMHTESNMVCEPPAVIHKDIVNCMVFQTSFRNTKGKVRTAHLKLASTPQGS